MPMREWLLFLPQTPATPSSLRVSVWRRMQQLGAVTLQNGVWILPRGHELERRLQMILADLEVQGGGGFLLVSRASHAEREEHIIERFRAERKQDYDEFLDRCVQFVEELKKETTAQKFTFAELEENEEDLHKLMQWLRKIYHRDFFGGAKRDEATNALTDCRRALKDYAAQVYLHLGYDPPEVLLIDEEGQEET